MKFRFSLNFLALVPLLVLLTCTSLLFAPGALSATKVRPGASCPYDFENRNYQGKMYTCIKFGKKWIWDKGVKIPPKSTPKSTPTPTPTPTTTPIPTPTSPTGLVGNYAGTGINFTFSVTGKYQEFKYYEIGLAYLVDSISDPINLINYSSPKVVRNVTTESFRIEDKDFLSFLLAESGQSIRGAVMARVRVVTASSNSIWSNGVYVTADSLQPAPAPTRAPAPAPAPTRAPVPAPAPSRAPTPTPIATPTPTPIKILKIFTISSTRSANCTSQNVNSTLKSAVLIVPSSGGGTGSLKYVYRAGTLTSGTHGAEVSAGTRETWTKATFQSPFVFQSTTTWYADVQITCSYYE